MDNITDIESEIKRAEDFLSEGPNGSERMAILSTIEELKRKLNNLRKDKPER
tara:strand:- start:328 stop:483 length:156 start_codon:yes stop_codon:yes gene_type:complete